MKQSLTHQLLALFARHFGGTPDCVAVAPGRVNLIGEHTDYNLGFVLPMAIDRYTLVGMRARGDGRINIHAADLGGLMSSFTVGAGPTSDAAHGWTNYLRGLAAKLPAHGVPVSGADVVIAGDMPQGAGLSSSAALENAAGLALAALAGQADIDRTVLARIGQQAEHEFAGCQCGIMDQLVSACAEPDHALLIDCRDLSRRHVALPRDAAVLIVHSGVVRGLVDGEYNLRRAQCEAAACHFGVASLRDLDPARLDGPDAATLDRVALRRARHVLGENARVLAMGDALAAGDLAACGQLMAQSHASMRDDFAITVPPVDDLVAILQSAIGPCGGARMTGGGFGGAVVAMLPARRLAQVQQVVGSEYRTPAGLPAEMMTVRPPAGARLLGPF